MDYTSLLKDRLQNSIRAKEALLGQPETLQAFADGARRVVDSYKKGGRLYIAGNGGSAADAQHIAAEFVSKIARPRNPLPAEALTVDTSILTAIGNDYGYEEVFARQIAGKMKKEDIFLAITTSGRSPNILKALKECQSRGITTILFTGREGGPARELADFCITAPGSDTSTVQEVHIVLGHTLCLCVEAELFPV